MAGRPRVHPLDVSLWVYVARCHGKGPNVASAVLTLGGNKNATLPSATSGKWHPRMNTPITADEARRLAAKFCGPARQEPTHPEHRREHTVEQGRANKRAIMQAIRRMYRASAKEVALAAGLHVTTTRNHLGEMRADGLVLSAMTRKAEFNHPVEVWGLTDKGKELAR